MVHFGPIKEEVRSAYRHSDRLIVFDGPDEFRRIKEVATGRILRRILDVEEPYGQDLILAGLPDDMPALVASPEVVEAISDMLRQESDAQLGDKELTAADHAATYALADEIVIESKVFDVLGGQDISYLLGGPDTSEG